MENVFKLGKMTHVIEEVRDYVLRGHDIVQVEDGGKAEISRPEGDENVQGRNGNNRVMVERRRVC